MQLSNIATGALVVAATIIPYASAGCYVKNGLLDGLKMPIDHLRYHATRACRGYEGTSGVFQGFFKPEERTKVCVPTGGNHIDMEVGNLNTQEGFDLNDEDCEKELHSIITECSSRGKISSGGRFDVAGWTFRVDPNAGGC